MNELKKTTLKLTFVYSLVFFGFIWAFSAGIYLWTNNALGKGYVNHITELVQQTTPKPNRKLSDSTATLAADVALDRLRNIILTVNGVALVLIPTLAYQLSKRSLRPLVKSQLEQQQFISNASHELRTPLAIMSGELELARRPGRSKEEYRETIESTSQEVARMTSLVRELLLISRVDSTDKLEHTESLNLNNLIHEAIQSHQSKASHKSVTVVFTESKQPLNVTGQHELLIIALGNLIDNAIKFSPKKDTIVIEAKQIANEVKVSVKNHGPEIPQEKIDHLFERFYQTERSHSAQGYGLGLAITSQIVRLHKGSLNVVSNKKQTVFTMTLPVSK